MIEDYLAYTVLHDGALVCAEVRLQSVVDEIAAVYEGPTARASSSRSTSPTSSRPTHR